MTRRQRFARTALAGALRSAVAIGVLLVVSGTHMARRSNTDTNDTDGASPSRNRDTDAPNTRAQRAKNLDTLTGRARPTIGAPTPPKGRYPRDNTRTTEDRETIVADRSRDLPVDWTKGFTENLDAPKQNEDGSWTINLRMHDGWNQEHFDAKAQPFEGLAANDKLELKTGDGEDRGARLTAGGPRENARSSIVRETKPNMTLQLPTLTIRKSTMRMNCSWAAAMSMRICGPSTLRRTTAWAGKSIRS